jgi:hypothetical protein
MLHVEGVRTTLTIDDDVLAAARAIAERDRRPTGAVLSDLARKGIRGQKRSAGARCGFPALPHREVVVTPELVNALRDDEE